MKKVWDFIACACVVLLCASAPASAQIYDAEGQYVDTVFHDHINRQADDFITASLVICDPTDVLYSTLGHACLHMQCPAFGKDYFFSYEGEDVGRKVWTFLRGDLKMGMVAWEPEAFLGMYAEEGRGVREYSLNLTPLQKQSLWYYLDQRVKEGMALPYDFFRRGCAKAVVQVIKSALGPQAIQYGTWPERFVEKTQRELVADYIDCSPWNEFVLYFLIGTEGDEDCTPEQKLIIPSDLVEVWQMAEIDGRPLLGKEAHELLPSVSTMADEWFTPLLVALLLLLVSWFSPYPILVAQTLLGALMAYLIGLSDLPCTTWNWLLIPFNPLPVMMWHWRRYWALPWAIVLTGWIAAMMAYPHHLVDWPHLVLTASFALMLLRQTDWYSYCKKKNDKK